MSLQLNFIQADVDGWWFDEMCRWNSNNMPRNQCELLTIYLESTGKNVYHDAEEEKIIKPSIINDNSDKNKSRKRLSLKFLETKCLGLIKKNLHILTSGIIKWKFRGGKIDKNELILQKI